MSAGFLNPEKGTWVLLSFIIFFGVIVAVNSVFIVTALSTHTGVVTEQPYEKGLAYDETLKVARAQPDIKQDVVFENGVLRWILNNEKGEPLKADVHAHIIRPIKDGQDFEIALVQKQRGVYEVDLDLPMKGRWDAQLKAEWDNKQYQTRFSFMAK